MVTLSIGAVLRVFFRLLYHQLAWSYDLVAATVSLGQWKNWVQSILPFVHGPRVLEIGHGPGHLQVTLRSRHLDAVGLDESRQMSRQAYRRLSKTGYTPRLVNGLAQQMPFPTGSFHQIVATFPSEYIAQPQTLAEIRRVLSPGGELLLLPFAWITSNKLPHRLAAWLFRVTGQAPAARFLLHPEELALEPFSQPFLDAGFQVSIEWIRLPASILLLVHALRTGEEVARISPD